MSGVGGDGVDARVQVASGVVVEGDGLAVPEAGHVVLAVLRVVQVEAVGGGGACGELPPELGAFGAVRDVEQAGKSEGTGELDTGAELTNWAMASTVSGSRTIRQESSSRLVAARRCAGGLVAGLPALNKCPLPVHSVRQAPGSRDRVRREGTTVGAYDPVSISSMQLRSPTPVGSIQVSHGTGWSRPSY